jgi:hypothetical protein
MNVVGNDVGVLGELLLAESAFAPLGGDLLVKQLPHLAAGAEFPVSPGMLRILDTPDAQLALAPFPWDCFPATADQRTTDRAELISMESHARLLNWSGGLLIVRGCQDLKGWVFNSLRVSRQAFCASTGAGHCETLNRAGRGG